MMFALGATPRKVTSQCKQVESYQTDPLCQAVEQAWNAGIVVVVAAGNYGRDNPATTNGYGTITAPGNDPYVITVGAMKTMGTHDPDRRRDRHLQLQGPDRCSTMWSSRTSSRPAT